MVKMQFSRSLGIFEGFAGEKIQFVAGLRSPVDSIREATFTVSPNLRYEKMT